MSRDTEETLSDHAYKLTSDISARPCLSRSHLDGASALGCFLLFLSRNENT